MGESIRVNIPDGEFAAYLARPANPKAGTVVVLPEIFGVNDDMRTSCDELAKSGFIAICPDLFWRLEPGLDLNHWSKEEWEKGLALYAAFDFNLGVEDVGHVVAAGRKLSGSNGKVGVTGFCLGGLMTYLTAARKNIDAAVEYYGGATDQYLSEAPQIEAPFIVHLGEDDEFISKDAQENIKDAFARSSNVEIFTYPHCGHAFARHTGIHFDAEAAQSANARTTAFFHKHLGG